MSEKTQHDIVFLDDVASDDFGQVGSKAGRLGLARQQGLAVPDGFVVTTSVFERVVQASEPLSALCARVGFLDLESMTDPHLFYTQARQAFANVPLAPDTQRAIEDAYRSLGEGDDALATVAVRSSAVAEDLGDASFAGQYETILEVHGPGDLFKALRACWTSLWTRRSLHYAMWHSVPLADLRMAVLVQTMAPAKAAGVLFTRSPDPSDRGGMLVEAVAGLGEQLVSGNATPYRYHLPSSLEHAPDTAGPLQGHHLASLHTLGETIEQAFGQAQDIEWVVADDDTLSLVQVRPATTPAPLSKEEAAATGADRPDRAQGSWSRDLVGEWFRSPTTPLFASAALASMATQMFVQLEEHFGVKVHRPCWRLWHGYLYFRADMRSLLWGLLRLPFTLLRGFRTVEGRWKNEFLPGYQEQLEHHRQQLERLPQLSDDELLATIERLAALMASGFAWTIFTGAYAFGAEWIFRTGWRLRHPFRGSLSYTSRLGNIDNTTRQANQALIELVSIARASSTPLLDAFERKDDSDPLLSACGRWLEQYGHRVNDLDILEPTMQEDPIQLIRLVESLSRTAPSAPEAADEKGLEETPHHTKETGGLLGWVRRYYAIREDRPFYLHQGWPLMRRVVLEAGRRLVRAGQLDYANDVVFLEHDQLLEALREGEQQHRGGGVNRLHDDIIARRRQWLQERRITPPAQLNPRWWQRLFLRPQSPSSKNAAHTWRGTPGSPGRVTAPVRCIRGPEEFAFLKPGEILVAPATTPAWTPLFIQAAGLITERGGALSHGAIVSREYGIPAVLGVDGILDELVDGMVVTVDGKTGEVRIQ